MALTGAPASAEQILSDGTVRFQVGSADLTMASERVLDRLAKLLKRRPELDPVELVGHADDRGAEKVNRALSLKRAEAVRAALVSRGIRSSRIRTRGAGSADPISREDSVFARELNRRVEVWITPQTPVAEVTHVERKVRSREAAAPQWRKAKVGQSLRRLAKVQTGKSSASEVSFRSKDQVQLGPEALVVIYDSPGRTRRNKAEVDDIEVEQGTIFASMAAKDRALRVKTKPSRVEVRSKRTRVDVRTRRRRAKAGNQRRARPAKRKVSTVSVFEGKSKVSAAGKSVTVREGFGTRVEEGKAPEPPRPLPVAPPWSVQDPYIVVEGRPLDLAWTRAPGVKSVEVQLGLHDDPEVKRPHRLWRVDGDRTRGGSARAGLYHLRLVGVDDRGVSGAPGRTLRLVVLPAPTDGAGAPWPVAGGRVHMTRPGILAMANTASVAVASQTATAAPLRAALSRPGAHDVDFVLRTPSRAVKGSLPVWVDTATLTVSVSAPEVTGDRSRTEVRLSLASGAGPVDGLEWVAGVVPRPTRRLALRAGAARPLADCRCGTPPGASAVEALGDGQYRWTLDVPLPAPTSSVTVRLYEAAGRLAVEVPATIGSRAWGGAARGRSETDKSGLFGGLRVGALVSHADAPTAELSAELGYRLELGLGLELDASVEAGWLSRDITGQTVHAVPILGRIALGLDLGAPRIYAGGGGGVRILDPGPDLGGVATGFVGAGYRFGHSEVIVEGAYRLVGRALGADEELAGWAVIVGYRVGTFYLGD